MIRRSMKSLTGGPPVWILKIFSPLRLSHESRIQTTAYAQPTAVKSSDETKLQKAIHHFQSTCNSPLSELQSRQVNAGDSHKGVAKKLTNTVGLGLFGDSSSVVLLIRLDWCFPAPEVVIPVLSASNRFRVSPCLDCMLMRTCFITANSWRIVHKNRDVGEKRVK